MHTRSQCGDHTFIIKVLSEQCEESIYIPTAFSPNSDGVNDKLKPLGLNFTAISFSIYDRYGAMVFKGVPGNMAWNGKYKHEDVMQGVYFYNFKYKNSRGEIKYKHGTVMVLR